ncbi:MAG TPA: YihY/virulence factor BrkB family protein [Acidobacteriaceae bacterium]
MKEEPDAEQAAATPERKRAVVAARHQRMPLAALRKQGLWPFAKRVGIAAMKEDITGRAAQLAYYFFFALFPMLIAASALVGLAARSASDLNSKLLAYLGKVIPPSAYQVIADTLHQTTHASNGGKVLFGALTALWSASVGTTAIQDALNAVHQVEEKRPFWKARLNAVLLTLAIGVIFTAALVTLFFGDKLVENRHGGFGTVELVAVRLLTWPVAFALVAIVFALVYSKAPSIKGQPWEWVTPGAALGIILWLVASQALRLYLHYFDTYSVTYGSLGAVIVLLTWFYISGLALLLGAVINDTMEVMAGEMLDDQGQVKGASATAA